MRASLRGASLTEDSANSKRSSTWASPEGEFESTAPRSVDRSVSVPIELAIPIRGTSLVEDLVAQPLQYTQSRPTGLNNIAACGRAPIVIRGKRISVGDLVGKFDSKHPKTESGPPPPIRAVTTPSPRLRRVYQSAFPKLVQGSSHRPPRRRLVSSETTSEAGGVFTLEQIEAATSHTIPKNLQTAVLEPVESTAVELEQSARDASAPLKFDHKEKSTQIEKNRAKQVLQTEHPSQDASTQASPSVRDQSTQSSTNQNSRTPQTTLRYQDRFAQIASAYQDHCTQTTDEPQQVSQVKGKCAFQESTFRTDCETHYSSKAAAQSQGDLAGRVVSLVTQGGDLGRLAGAADRALERQSSTPFFTVPLDFEYRKSPKNLSPIVDILLKINGLYIDFPESTRVMLRQIRGDKIVLDPVVASSATSSEAFAPGEIYASGYLREEEAKPAQQSPQTPDCSSCSSESSYCSVERENTARSKTAAIKASKAAEDSRYTEARQQPSSQQTAQRSLRQLKIPKYSEAAADADLVDSLESSLPNLRKVASSTDKERRSSHPYWFDLEEEDPAQAPASSLVRPQTIAQFRSVPVIRIQRPSTDSEMLFSLSTRAVKPSHSAAPVLPAEGPATVPFEEVSLPDVNPPTTSSDGRGHLRERLRNRGSKQRLPTHTPGGDTVGLRARLKRKGGNIGRRGRKKVVFRKRVLRILLGKDLAETVHQSLQTTDNATGAPIETVTGPAQHMASGVAITLPPTAVPSSLLPSTGMPTSGGPPVSFQVDGSASYKRNFVSGYFPTETGGDTAPVTLVQINDSHEKKLAKLKEKGGKRQEKYTSAKMSLETLLSTPCSKCEGHEAAVLGYVYAKKKVMQEHELPNLMKKERRFLAQNCIETLERKCPTGTRDAGNGAPGALLQADITP